jgi:hypothetical protein
VDQEGNLKPESGQKGPGLKTKNFNILSPVGSENRIKHEKITHTEYIVKVYKKSLLKSSSQILNNVKTEILVNTKLRQS